jgi:hypothetical protein
MQKLSKSLHLFVWTPYKSVYIGSILKKSQDIGIEHFFSLFYLVRIETLVLIRGERLCGRGTKNLWNFYLKK